MDAGFDFVRPPEMDGASLTHPVAGAGAGAGPVGLSLAIDLAQAGHRVVLLDEDGALATGSRAICFAQRTLEVFDRLGCGEAMAAKGVCWQVGRVFLRGEELYSFDLKPEPGHLRPAFVNLQQYHVEAFLLERAAALPWLEIRWHNRVTGVAQDADGVRLTVGTPGGAYTMRCAWLVAADGSRSPVCGLLGHEIAGQTFRDRFLIADVRMTAPFPAERWFWFDPPFHSGGSVLLHRQLFAGDAAHNVSPFGARGANSGVQDLDNLGWKLRAVLDGVPDALLDTYAAEREAAADEDIQASTRSTDFITPTLPVSGMLRDAVLELARTQPFARPMVNSGRLSAVQLPAKRAEYAGPGRLAGRRATGCAGPGRAAGQRLVAGTAVAARLYRPALGRSAWHDAGNGHGRHHAVRRAAGHHVFAAPRWPRLRLPAALRPGRGRRRPATCHRMLITPPNLAAPDDGYEMLIEAHRTLSEAESHRFNARLILILCNHIGDPAVLAAALAAAKA